MGRYERPPRLAEALELAESGGFTLLAGGTDFYPARVGRAITDDILDLTAVETLNGIGEELDHWRLGALTTWTKLIETPLPPMFDGYKLAAREVGGRQIQNTGTLAGNLCNASPAADGTPNLLALQGLVEIASRDRVRRVPVQEFVAGNRKTLRQDNEIVTALIIPKPPGEARSAFRKLGARKYLIISIVMAAVVIEVNDQRCVSKARVAVGSCSAAAQRLPLLEAVLQGASLANLADLVRFEHMSDLSPISDVRGSAEYRSDAALEIVRRALGDIARC